MESDRDNLTHQDEALPASEFEQEEERDRHHFGNWPEAAGLAFTILVTWLVFAFTG
ncbi:hypothetical protein [Roseibium salinum]|uniref:Aa3 type cytochrome c oxidase subunit IV n=1 Tax=Roseibium salinum TaxID=1604349 RepID=A0ABT3QW42_9HYPH|nr:hypothetical protein [Roseibium sp. DSM 29163]MCX2721076.1 hypothetical protein [Roseibium sp. DSM 29163]